MKDEEGEGALGQFDPPHIVVSHRLPPPYLDTHCLPVMMTSNASDFHWQNLVPPDETARQSKGLACSMIPSKKKKALVPHRISELSGPLLLTSTVNIAIWLYALLAFQWDPQNTDINTQTLVQQPSVPLTEPPHGVQQATSGNQDIIVAILLLLLPNLTTLIIPSTRYCEALIRRVVKWCQESIIPQPNLPLAKFENVVIGDDRWNSIDPGEFFIERGIIVAILLLLLPNLKTLIIPSIPITAR